MTIIALNCRFHYHKDYYVLHMDTYYIALSYVYFDFITCTFSKYTLSNTGAHPCPNTRTRTHTRANTRTHTSTHTSTHSRAQPDPQQLWRSGHHPPG